MESKDGALLSLSSGVPPSAPRTGQGAFTTSGGLTNPICLSLPCSMMILQVTLCAECACLVLLISI